MDALAIACIHRVAHHGDEQRLIWLYDIHLLAGALTAAEAEDFLSLAAAKRIRAVCARGCSLAHARFGTSFPTDLADRLAASSASNVLPVPAGPTKSVRVFADIASRASNCSSVYLLSSASNASIVAG